MYDSEVGDHYFNEDSFGETSVRHGFIRKVYAILFVQIAITAAMISLFIYVDAIKDYSRDNQWMWILAIVLTFVILIILACCPDFRRRSPINFVLLIAFTVCEGFLLGAVSSCYDRDEVLMAVGITGLVALALTIFAFQTRWDFTMMGGMLFVLVIVLICFGLLCAIIPSRVLNIVYSAIGALIFSAYLVFDTQLMLGGKHKYSLSPEEYIFAALNLYLDIVNLFLFILSLIGASRD